jgi:hypothetical protein
MNKGQLTVLWAAGILIAGILFNTGLKLLKHAAASEETIATGYPFTLLAGTIWTYILPILIIGALLFVTFKKNRK